MSDSEGVSGVSSATSSLGRNTAPISPREAHGAIDMPPLIHSSEAIEMSTRSSEEQNTEEAKSPAQPVLPDPSPEQQKVIAAIKEGKCVTVRACAGSGKTTCMLQVASSLPSTRKVLIITYNRSLADDCKARIQKLSLGHRVSCYTIHGLASRVAGKVCNDDHKLIELLNQWDNSPRSVMSHPVPLDMVMLDEAQDLRPLFYKVLSHIFRTVCGGAIGNTNRSMQLCLVGDPKQLLYDFPTYGSDKASASFFLQPESYWSQFTRNRKWIQLSLSVSYRLTPCIASFCNLFWGTSMVGGNTSSHNLPVQYLMKYAYPNTSSRYDPDKLSTSFLAKIIDKHGPENVLFLAQSIKNVDLPIRVHVNELMKIKDRHTGMQKYNFHIKESVRGFEGNVDWKNKVRVWTFCGSKGCEADVVVVFGFEVFRKPHGLNQIGVALSRARKRLFVIHGKRYIQGQCLPLTYYPILGDTPSRMEQHVVRWGENDSQILTLDVPDVGRGRSDVTKWALGQLADKGVIKIDFGASDNDTMPQSVALAQQQVKDIYVASEFGYFSALAETKFLQYGAWETIASMKDGKERNKRIPYETNIQFATTTEDVSALYGEAVTYMLQWEMCKSVPNVETVVSNGIIRLHPQSQYTEQLIREHLRDISCEELSEEDSHRLEREFATKGNNVKGAYLINFMNAHLSLKKKRVIIEGDQVREINFRVKVVECKSEDDDKQLNEFLPQIKAIYELEMSSKRPFHWVYLANAVMAFSNYHEKFRQIGTDPDSYESWVNSEALLDGLERLRNTMKLISSSSSTSKYVENEGKSIDKNIYGNNNISNCKGTFERELHIDFAEDDWIHERNNGRMVVGVGGICDWINGDGIRQNIRRQKSKGDSLHDVDLLEIKFVHQLSNIHRLQVLVYCALYVLELNNQDEEKKNGVEILNDCHVDNDNKDLEVEQNVECCRGMLYNARTEEMEICSIKACDAMDFLLDISQFKYNGKDRKQELLQLKQTANNSVGSDEMSISSSYRPKRPKKRLERNSGLTYYTAFAVDDDEDDDDDDVKASAKSSNGRCPRTYRWKKRPKPTSESAFQPGTGTDDDPIILD